MYRKRDNSRMKHIDFILLDLATMAVSFYLGYVVRHGLSPFWNHKIYLSMFVALLLLDLCVAFCRDSYSGIIRRGYLEEWKDSVLHCLITCGLLLLYFFLIQRSQVYSRMTMLVFTVLWCLSTYVVRCLRKHQIRVRMMKDTSVEQMLILTDLEHAEACVTEMSQEIYRGYQIVGVVLWKQVSKARSGTIETNREVAATIENSSRHQIGGVSVVAEIKDLDEYLLGHVVDSVFIEAEMPRVEREELIARLVESGVTVHNTLAHVPHGLKHQAIERIGNYTVFTTGMHIATNRQILYKRVMDILGGACGSILALIAVLIFGPVIYIQSPGPIFFTQTRVGKNGRKFEIYKFRSMYPDAEQKKAELMKQNEMEGLMFKMKEDPRIIPIGHFLRKFSIDELPQFFNVLRGDMSLVGTRPPTIDEFEQYQLHHRGRLNSKPGITGLWQISGRNDITDFEEVVRLDTMYIMNWSISEDIRILWKTVKQVVKGEGS